MSAASDIDPKALAPAAPARTRPFYWSLRRELWENRWLLIAPVAAALVVLAGLLIGSVFVPSTPHLAIAQSKHADLLHVVPYNAAALGIMATVFILSVLYCLGALHGERRDRSILFWKSLPVSNLVTVLAKAAVPLAVLPVFALAVITVTQLVMLAIGAVVLLVTGSAPLLLSTRVDLVQMWLVLPYGVVVMALWHAPIWGWLLMVSAWARRTVFLWAFGPPLALCIFEGLAFRTHYLTSILAERVGGALVHAFNVRNQPGAPLGHIADIDPLRFLATPGLWIGLVVAAAFLAAAAWLRRRGEPI